MSSINLARVSAFCLIYCWSSPSIITRIKGSVPEGLIKTLPFPENSSSSFWISFCISSSDLYNSFLSWDTFAFTNTCGYAFIILHNSDADFFF